MRLLLTADPTLPVPPKLYGGIERVIHGLVGELRARGHDVGLVAHPDSTTVTDVFYPWPSTSAGGASGVHNAPSLRSAVLDFCPDVLHSFSRLLYLLPLLDSHVPRIMSYQREPTGRTIRWSRRLAGERLTFTGCSAHIAAQGRARGGGDWHAIPNFVDTTALQFAPDVASDAPLVFLSRVERIKGAHMAIRVARATGRRLVIAGNRDAAHDEYWRTEIEPHLGLDGVEYIGPVDDVQKNTLLGGAAAMLVPIEWDEPFGIVFAESLACGTPVISCPRGALPEIVREGTDGFLAPDFDGLVRAVRRIPEIDRRRCRERAESTYSTAAVTAQYEALYATMVARTAGRDAKAHQPNHTRGQATHA